MSDFPHLLHNIGMINTLSNSQIADGSIAVALMAISLQYDAAHHTRGVLLIDMAPEKGAAQWRLKHCVLAVARIRHPRR